MSKVNQWNSQKTPESGQTEIVDWPHFDWSFVNTAPVYHFIVLQIKTLFTNTCMLYNQTSHAALL